jgi:NADH:ubiquinone oxidoreductase subunit C
MQEPTGWKEKLDFYGIKFKGHPDLRPILNMEDLGYHPMLKEYRLKTEQEQTRTINVRKIKNNDN